MTRLLLRYLKYTWRRYRHGPVEVWVPEKAGGCGCGECSVEHWSLVDSIEADAEIKYGPNNFTIVSVPHDVFYDMEDDDLIEED